MRQQISPVRKRRIAELGLRHDERWLERELVPQQYIEVEDLRALVHVQGCLVDLELNRNGGLIAADWDK